MGTLDAGMLPHRAQARKGPRASIVWGNLVARSGLRAIATLRVADLGNLFAHPPQFVAQRAHHLVEFAHTFFEPGNPGFEGVGAIFGEVHAVLLIRRPAAG